VGDRDWDDRADPDSHLYGAVLAAAANHLIPVQMLPI